MLHLIWQFSIRWTSYLLVSRQPRNSQKFLVRYHQLQIYKQPLVINYQLCNVAEDSLEDLKTAISRKADIRLFSCQIEFKTN